MLTATQVARNRANAGMALAADHAEAVSPGWADEAYAALRSFAMQHQRFTSYDFRRACLIDPPTTAKAFGAVFQRAARAGLIVKIGYDSHPERHLSPTVLWGSNIYGMAL
jgi:hypothetical protein